MPNDRERKIRDRAHRLWEDEGRPEGRQLAHWGEAERQVLAEEAAGWRPEAPDDVSTETHGSPPADPLRNPELVPPSEDLEYPAVTGPEQVSAGRGAAEASDPLAVAAAARPDPTKAPDGTLRAAGVRRLGRAEVKLRRRPGNSTLE
jgi:hypothetical protein